MYSHVFVSSHTVNAHAHMALSPFIITIHKYKQTAPPPHPMFLGSHGASLRAVVLRSKWIAGVLVHREEDEFLQEQRPDLSMGIKCK